MSAHKMVGKRDILKMYSKYEEIHMLFSPHIFAYEIFLVLFPLAPLSLSGLI